MEIIIVIVLFISALLLAYLLNRGFEREIVRIHEREMGKLSDTLKNVTSHSNEYQFFTDGHPYVWVRSNYSEMVSSIKNCCRGQQGVPIEPIYSLLVSETNKNVYFVSRKKNFDFSSLKHYDDWLESNKQVAENIAQYKNS